MKLYFISLVVLVGILEVVGDVFFKSWIIQNKNALMFVGIAFYMAGVTIWAYSLKFQCLSKADAIFAILTLVVGALAGVIFFKDKLTIINIIGLFLGLISIILIEK